MSDRADDRDEAYITCDECGHKSTDPEAFILVNVEPARMSMDDPYPGYPGDYVCAGSCDDHAPTTTALWQNSSGLADLPSGTAIPGIGEV